MRKKRPVAVMEYSLNGQYMIEGFTAGFLFSLGGLGFIIMNLAVNRKYSKVNQYIILGAGILCVVAAYNVLLMFLRMKIPGMVFFYLSSITFRISSLSSKVD